MFTIIILAWECSSRVIWSLNIKFLREPITHRAWDRRTLFFSLCNAKFWVKIAKNGQYALIGTCLGETLSHHNWSISTNGSTPEFSVVLFITNSLCCQMGEQRKITWLWRRAFPLYHIMTGVQQSIKNNCHRPSPILSRSQNFSIESESVWNKHHSW